MEKGADGRIVTFDPIEERVQFIAERDDSCR
jgi:hypothetical protein